MNLLLLLSFFGALQGCTEVFPISSAGHLAIARQFFHYPAFNWELSSALQMGSLLAIVFYFRKDLRLLWSGFQGTLPQLRDWIRGGRNPFALSGEQNLLYFMATSFVLVIVEARLMEKLSSQIFERAGWVSLFFLINALILRIMIQHQRGGRTIKELMLRDFLIICLIQGLAMVPGISRLGLLIGAGLWLGMNLQEAFKLAILQLIPVLAGSLLLQSGDILRLLEQDPHVVNALIPAILFAAVCSSIGLQFFRSRYLEREKLVFFSSYCFMIGMTSFIYLQF